MEGRHNAFALALLLASLILISGCTSSKYNPCCVKSGLYDDTGNQQPSPKCYFPNETLFGTCTLDVGVTGAANCTDGSSCGSIDNEEDCTKTASCTWDAAATPKCTGTQATWLLSVCQDLMPKSCVNDKCIAMVCGYSSISPSPPPASQDWDANKSAQDFADDPSKLSSAMPPSGITTPVVNLQGATCDFNKMNKKLYNKMTSSSGNLWVNSFRFGVGSSFADYETARNYFPATDRVCAANPYAKTDRFTIYLNSKDTFCQPGSFYTCNKLPGVTFKDLTNCQYYCGGGVAPYVCAMGAGTKYICNSDGFAYTNQSDCRQKCGIIKDVNACTNDKTQFPFLDTDDSEQARYRLKYMSDYMVDTPGSRSSASCSALATPEGTVGFPFWSLNYPDPPYEPYACNDYAGWGDGPWFWTYSCAVANSWRAPGDPDNPCPVRGGAGDYMGELRTYFDNHAYSSVDFDYDYYVKNLYDQYKDSPDAQGRLQYECASGNECLSGSCDTTYYKRPMCKDLAGNPVACACSKAQFGTNTYYPSCNLASGSPAYSDTGIPGEGASGRNLVSEPINSYGPLFFPAQSVHLANGSASASFNYYFPSKPPLFEICAVAPTQPTVKKMCVLHDRYCVDDSGDWRVEIASEKSIWPAEGDGKCHYSMEGEPCDSSPVLVNGVDYWEYGFNLNSMNPANTVNAGKFGNCSMNGEVPTTPSTPPYLDTVDLGWCAPCTYATLAVQKVDFGATTNPGGVGSPRALSCYEYRGEFNYIPDVATYPSGSPTSPSTQIVRMDSNPSAYERDTDGNLYQSWTDGNGYNYYCQDKWHGAGGWWTAAEIPNPSAPYLKEKLTSYLQSNVMPILDVQSSKTTTPAAFICQWADSVDTYAKCLSTGWLYTSRLACVASCNDCEEQAGAVNGYYCPPDGRLFSPSWNGQSMEANSQACSDACFSRMEGKSYPPLAICNSMGGDGGVVHVIGNSSMLYTGGGGMQLVHGTILPGSLDYETRRYLGLTGVPDGQSTMLTGNPSIMVRASLLKQDCSTPPLAGIEILPTENATTLIGTGDLADPANPNRGKLHRFFYNTTEQGFAYRAANGMPDKVPDNVDMLLLDWYPLCLGAGVIPGENEKEEFDNKMEFARAIMANFSKPMLVWKFAFPQNTHCNTTAFLDYMFNNTAAMVDSGMIGVIYSDWMMKDGLGYGPETRSYNDNFCYPGWVGGNPQNCVYQHNFNGDIDLSGLTTLRPTVRGSSTSTLTLDNPRGMLDPTPGKGALFCALQLFSKRAIGFIPLTYGQKLYADNQTCECLECTDFDYITGACDSAVKASSDPSLPQIYCNDGAKCAMPGGRSDTGHFRCTDRCMNATACKLCSDVSNNEYSSFCRITPVGGATFGTSRCYNNITDDYWEFLAGLSPSEKCCLQSSAADQSSAKYTYTIMTGTKQQSEFLQFPGHGEQNIDCGRSPDTSVLTYCNIRVPISQKEIACMRVETPLCETLGGNTPPIFIAPALD